MGSQQAVAINGMVFAFFGTSLGLLDCDWLINFFKNGDGVWFLYSRLVFLAEQCVPSPSNKAIVGFCFINELSST